MCPVRELSPGERPRDWVASGNESANDLGIMPPDAGEALNAPGPEAEVRRKNAVPNEMRRTSAVPAAPAAGRDAASSADGTHTVPRESRLMPHHTRRRGRHIPAAIRRAVFERDGNQCTYASTAGKRCEETHRLEFHHLTPFAAGGEHAVSNLTLRCAAHHALAAEEEFGRELIEEKKRARGHDT
jgi:5-methylcytosine-specific restriction endonuclease McrA